MHANDADDLSVIFVALFFQVEQQIDLAFAFASRLNQRWDPFVLERRVEPGTGIELL